MSSHETADAILACFQPNTIDGLTPLGISRRLDKAGRLPIRAGNLIDLSAVGRALADLVDQGLLSRIGNLYVADTRQVVRSTYPRVAVPFRPRQRASA